MDIKELQIDDWIEVYSENGWTDVQVSDINEFFVTDRAGDKWSENEIEPIPITRMMLEDNSFIRADKDKYGRDVYRRDAIAVTVLADGYAAAVTINRRGTASLTWDDGTCVYVHEVQHLLRMKEIVFDFEL